MMLVAVVVGVPLLLVAAVLLGVLLVRWSKRNAARAAAMMSGTYLQDVRVDDAPSSFDGFVDWLGDCVDDIEHAAPGEMTASGCGNIATETHHAPDACSGDSGGCCGGD